MRHARAAQPDPMYAGLAEKLQGVKVEESRAMARTKVLQPVFKRAKIFRVDLYEKRQGWANMWTAFSLS